MQAHPIRRQAIRRRGLAEARSAEAVAPERGVRGTYKLSPERRAKGGLGCPVSHPEHGDTLISPWCSEPHSTHVQCPHGDTEAGRARGMRGQSCDCQRHDWSRKGVKDARFFSHTKPQSHEEGFRVSIENPRETVFSLRRRFFFIRPPLRVLVSLCAIRQVYVDGQ